MSRAVLHFCRGECAHGKPDNTGIWAMPSCEYVKLRLRWVELQRGMESQHHLETIAKNMTVTMTCNMAPAMYLNEDCTNT